MKWKAGLQPASWRWHFMKQPVTPELRKYLLDLVREERSLEYLYRISHTAEELRAVRAEWKAAYRSLRASLVLEDMHIRVARRRVQMAGTLRIILTPQ